MRIKKILNNNVVMIDDQFGEEAIVWGKGLAFNKKVGDLVDVAVIEKVFPVSDSEIFFKLQDVMKDIPIDYFEITSQILEMVEKEISEKWNETLLISLSDHIFSSVRRYEEGITISNPLTWDIKRIYPKEFKIGMSALEIINERFRVTLNEDEAAFIATHIVNAVIDENQHDVIESEGYKTTILIQEILNIIRYFFKIEISEDSTHYFRFVSHLKFFFKRLLAGTSHSESPDPELFKMVSEKYGNASKCVDKISEFILEKYHYELTIEERLYLTVHIQRIVYSNTL